MNDTRTDNSVSQGSRWIKYCGCGTELVFESATKSIEYWRCPACHNPHWWLIDERTEPEAQK
jgi:hypothetical protein